VVICRDGERHVGIAVSHVLDVAAGGILVEAGTRRHTAGVTLLKDRVTSLVELTAIAPLGAVAPVGAEPETCNPWTEAIL
jgi:two-component system chemotaxis sensor kinase CheA